jgi:hypothetical protein
MGDCDEFQWINDKQNKDEFHSLFRKTYPRPHKGHISFVNVGRP